MQINFDKILTLASYSENSILFMYGLGFIYVTGFVLLIAVLFKFVKYFFSKSQKTIIKERHPISTLLMTCIVVSFLPFWFYSIGQLKMSNTLQYSYFAIGVLFCVFAIFWHIWAKINIGLLWSDDIEIKKNHKLITDKAFGLARHPMYGSLLMWCWGSSFIMMNWITLVLNTVIFLPLMIIRARSEERLLTKIDSHYLIYKENVHMLFPTISGKIANIIKISLIILFAYYVWIGLNISIVVLLFFLHLFLGYTLEPQKVAFSYRSKSAILVFIWLLSIQIPFVYYFLYIVLVMLIYGLKWDCPCMMMYEKYKGCPCFFLIKKLSLSCKDKH
jgi:protein-S-isoprenylcysteine O-methyltransferase Ste14